MVVAVALARSVAADVADWQVRDRDRAGRRDGAGDRAGDRDGAGGRRDRAGTEDRDGHTGGHLVVAVGLAEVWLHPVRARDCWARRAWDCWARRAWDCWARRAWDCWARCAWDRWALSGHLGLSREASLARDGVHWETTRPIAERAFPLRDRERLVHAHLLILAPRVDVSLRPEPAHLVEVELAGADCLRRLCALREPGPFQKVTGPPGVLAVLVPGARSWEPRQASAVSGQHSGQSRHLEFAAFEPALASAAGPRWKRRSP